MKALIFALLSNPAFAAVTHPCEGLNDIGMLLTARSFESVKVAHVSTEEPAVAPDHVLVFVYDNEMGFSCTAISPSAGLGYGTIDMNTLRSVGYDAKKGRLFEVTAYQPDIENGGPGKPETLRFRANARTAKVTLE